MTDARPRHRDGASGRAQLRAVCRFELELQSREPATYLYPLVFFLLAFAFASSSTVDLVRDDGTLPALSPLSLTLAMGGLSAFGQVITTTITASAFLRDRAVGADGLLFATAVGVPNWVLGRLLAVWIVVAIVYSAMPVGLLVGAAMPWVSTSPPLGMVAGSVFRAWVAITLPSSVAVAALLAAVGLRTQRLLTVLAGALVLLFLWQGCEAVIARVGPASTPALLAALADPFGTTAVQVVTGSWSVTERLSRPAPLWGLVLASRALWLVVAGAAVWFACRTNRATLAGAIVAKRVNATREDAGRVDAKRVDAERTTAGGLGGRVVARAHHLHQPASATKMWFAQFTAISAFTTRWLWRDRGWQVVAALGMLNVLVQSLGADTADGSAAAVVLRVQEHARLFLILLATVYAGELLWRDVDNRTEQLVHSAAVTSSALIGGRVTGVIASQGALVAALLLSAWLGGALRHGTSASLLVTLGAGALWLWVPFAQWMVFSLAVHVLFRHKVIAHLAIIAGWVLAFTLNANGVTAPWLRIADPPALLVNAPLALQEALWRALGWSALAGAALFYVIRRGRSATASR